MDEYNESICRSCLHSYVCEQFNEHRDSYNQTCHFYNNHFVPAADVAPVRHGRWDDDHKCTVCHNEAFCKISNIRPDYDYDWEENLIETGNYIWDTEWIETAYCPNCGAKMMEG